MRTVLTAGHAGLELESLRAMLAQAGAAVGIDARSEDLALGPLQAQLAAGALLVLAYAAPAGSVGGALKAAAGGAAPAVADLLASWRAGGELMLAMAVRHPAQCLLVNAEAALAAPDRLLAEAGQALGLELPSADMAAVPPAATSLSPLETLLADAMVAADRTAAALFTELESCAHLAHNPAPDGERLAAAAWAEYMATLESVAVAHAENESAQVIADAQAHALQLNSEFESRLVAMTRERDHHAELAVNAAAAADARETELARQAAQAQHLQREGEALLIQLHDAHLESEAYFKQAEEARAEVLAARQDVESARQEAEACRQDSASANDQLAAARKEALTAKQEAQVARLAAAGAGEEADGLRSALEAARESVSALKLQLLVHAAALQQAQEGLSRLEAEHADTKEALMSLQADTEGHREISQERDRTRLRLLQLNAGILNLQECAKRDAKRLAESEAARTMLRTFWHDHQPNPVCVDLRRHIVGENWYEAEPDGRWTGPERHSTLSLPPLKPGRYSIEITMAGAITREIAAGLRVDLNGRPLDLLFNRIRHPRLATATFDAPPPNDASAWLLGFQVPAVESPSERNSTDCRLLGVRVTEVKFVGETVKG